LLAVLSAGNVGFAFVWGGVAQHPALLISWLVTRGSFSAGLAAGCFLAMALGGTGLACRVSASIAHLWLGRWGGFGQPFWRCLCSGPRCARLPNNTDISGGREVNDRIRRRSGWIGSNGPGWRGGARCRCKSMGRRRRSWCSGRMRHGDGNGSHVRKRRRCGWKSRSEGRG